MPTRRHALPILALASLAACSGASAPPSAQGAAFDVAAAGSALRADCASGAGEWPSGSFYCGEILFDSMTGEGTILQVPTRLKAGDTKNAQTVCYLIAGDGSRLGFETVGVKFADGSNAAACSVPAAAEQSASPPPQAVATRSLTPEATAAATAALSGTGSLKGKPVLLEGDYSASVNVTAKAGCKWSASISPGYGSLDSFSTDAAGSHKTTIDAITLDRGYYVLEVKSSGCGKWSVKLALQ
ncbi:MAG: hypothetical protein U0838_01610 [Chloroflexota bacterium]